jgi:hypothetical protein
MAASYSPSERSIHEGAGRRKDRSSRDARVDHVGDDLVDIGLARTAGISGGRHFEDR